MAHLRMHATHSKNVQARVCPAGPIVSACACCTSCMGHRMHHELVPLAYPASVASPDAGAKRSTCKPNNSATLKEKSCSLGDGVLEGGVAVQDHDGAEDLVACHVAVAWHVLQHRCLHHRPVPLTTNQQPRTCIKLYLMFLLDGSLPQARLVLQTSCR